MIEDPQARDLGAVPSTTCAGMPPKGRSWPGALYLDNRMHALPGPFARRFDSLTDDERTLLRSSTDSPSTVVPVGWSRRMWKQAWGRLRARGCALVEGGQWRLTREGDEARAHVMRELFEDM